MNYGDSNHQSITDMNVTPMIDVMFVLLVLFLVSIPLMMPQTLGVDLPDTQAHNAADPEENPPYRLTLRSNGIAELDGEIITEERLAVRFEEIAAEEDARLLLEADKSVTYDRIAKLMVDAQVAGIAQLGFLTEAELGR
ncbi:biopolymer transporter ExbD [Spiribacter sp. C176]|uniref:Biopolymer transporter ExbD n=1 Tax=Spiribacter salilacus TaxID=2664894 RepID=A0A6N7QUC3_9GAMM|nr:biopolymer transporter ExbD [Spiribacter salilacus]MRH77927.1 biopolymer transporter ExbD [Spiribacter salilacus]